MLDLPLRLRTESDRPLYLQIAEQIIAFVSRGQLAPGSKLPPTRQLAGACGVHRNTVIAAYEELASQGYTEAGPGRGTFVARHLPDGVAISRKARSAPVAQRTARRPRNRAAFQRDRAEAGIQAADGRTRQRAGGPFSDLAEMLPGVSDHASILNVRRNAALALHSAAVAVELFPWQTFRAILGDVVGKQWRKLAQHDHPLGLESLRTALSSFLFSRGVTAEASEIVITTGSQQAIDLLARLFLNSGDCAVVEDPGYPAARQRFAIEGAHIEPVAVDDRGLRTDRLAAVLARRRVKLVYVTPNCQWPSSVQLSEERRQHLAELAERYDFVVLEDDYAAELRFRGPATVPLFMTMAPARCVNLGSFSKSLLPGLRLGYAVAPPEICGRLGALKLLTDSHSSLLVQAAVSEFLVRGHFETHLRKLRRECRLRFEAFTAQLQRRLRSRLSWIEPQAGTNLWCSLAGGLDAAAFAEFAAQQGILVSPGAAYFATPGQGRSNLLISFAAVAPGRASAAVEMLGSSLEAFAAEARPPRASGKLEVVMEAR